MSSRGKPPAGSSGSDQNDKDAPAQRRAWQPPMSLPDTQKRSAPNVPARPAVPSRRAPSGDAIPAPPRVPPASGRQRPDIPPDICPEPRSDTRPGSGFLRSSQQIFPRRPSLISRGERTLFWVLLAAVLAMSVFLVHYRNRVNAHFQERALAIPLATAAAGSSPAPLLLYLANDETGALVERSIAFPLPEDMNTRARVVLEKLLSEYTVPGSPHPLKTLRPGIESVDEVFLAPVPSRRAGQLAVVDLTPGFIQAHPAGIEPETLTLLSMIATLHANLPSVTEVHFLVDGAPCATLAGHADLSRTYLAGSAQMAPSEAFTVKAATQ